MKPPIEPDSAAIEIAYRMLHTDCPLEQMLASRPLSLILHNVARVHMQRRAQTDLKKLQAADAD